MADRWEFKNLGRQGPAARSPGMWPNGESEKLRAVYDAKLRSGGQIAPPSKDIFQAGTTTKVCYNCRGTGKSGGKKCTACDGTGSVPAAS